MVWAGENDARGETAEARAPCACAWPSPDAEQQRRAQRGTQEWRVWVRCVPPRAGTQECTVRRREERPSLSWPSPAARSGSVATRQLSQLDCYLWARPAPFLAARANSVV
eukprot:4706155-Prymnesium_polylepis.2